MARCILSPAIGLLAALWLPAAPAADAMTAADAVFARLADFSGNGGGGSGNAAVAAHEFRRLAHRVGMIVATEATRDLPIRAIQVNLAEEGYGEATKDDAPIEYGQVTHGAVAAFPRWMHARFPMAAGERIVAIGFCFGGRLAFLSATLPELGLTGAVGFYGPPRQSALTARFEF